MSLSARYLLITFIESFATILVERGVYFFSHDQLHFGNVMNLWLALALGVSYVAGAMLSHPVAHRLREKNLLVLAIAAQLIVHVGLAAWYGPTVIFLGNAALGFLNGIKWPVIESYVSAGQLPSAQANVIGQFNVAWASAVPLSLAVVSPIIAVWPSGLFLLGAALNAVSLWLARPVAQSPVHLAEDHPERPAEEQLPPLRMLLVSSRWLMLASYAALWILSAMLPSVYENLNIPSQSRSALSGLIDVVRVSSFILLWHYRGWHNRISPLLVAMLASPVGFFLILFGPGLAAVIAGELLFGLAAGMTYYAALYYAMVLKNASVGAGGGHEGLIGAGFAIGPAAGLMGLALTPMLGSYVLGIVAGVGPLYLLCSASAAWVITRTRSRKK